MDKYFYNQLRLQAIAQYPHLEQVIGAERAQQELRYGIEEQSHMLYPEEIEEIVSDAITPPTDPYNNVFGETSPNESRQYDFTKEEATEMLEQAAVEQNQRLGGVVTYMCNPHWDVV
jgi:hypothetical protein